MLHNQSIGGLISAINADLVGLVDPVIPAQTVMIEETSLVNMPLPPELFPKTAGAPSTTGSSERTVPVMIRRRRNIPISVPSSPKPVPESVTPVGETLPAPNEGPKRSVRSGESNGGYGGDASSTSRRPPHMGQPSGGLRQKAEQLTSPTLELPIEYGDEFGAEETTPGRAMEDKDSPDERPDVEQHDQSGFSGPDLVQQGKTQAVIGVCSLSTMLNEPTRFADFDNSHSVETLLASKNTRFASAELILEVVAVEGPRAARELVGLLVTRHPGLEITEPLLKAVARNEESDEELMGTLLVMLLPSDNYHIEVSETLLKVAASNKKCGMKLVALLQLVKNGVPFTTTVEKGSSANEIAGRNEHADPQKNEAPFTDLVSNSTSRSCDSGPSIASSQTSLRSVLPVVLRKAGDGIAKTLANGLQIMMIISEALKTQDSQDVDRRLFRALREFSKGVRKLGMTKGLSKGELSILRGIRKKDTLDIISVQIRNITEVKASHASRADALNSSNLLQQGELSNRTKVEELLRCDDPENPENTNNPFAELDESDDSHDSSDDDESAGVEFDKSIEQVLVFLKSDKVIELFQRSVMKRFHLVCRRLNLPSHVDRDQGTEHNEHTTGGSALNPQTCTLTGDLIVSPVTTTDRSHSWPMRFVRGKTDINFPFRSRWTLANEIKGLVEGLAQEPINWWPLSPRRYPLPKDGVWVTWKCVSPPFLADILRLVRVDSCYNNPS